MKRRITKAIKEERRIKSSPSRAMENTNLTPQRLEELRNEYNQKHRNHIQGKYPRQKMLPEYRQLYPWILPDEVDPYFAFCLICESRLSAKRCDLRKHETSIKHTANSAKKGVLMVTKSSPKETNDQEVGDSINEEDASGVEADDDDEDDNDDNEPYMKHEPIVELVENSSSALNMYNLSSPSDESMDRSDDDDGDDDSNSYKEVYFQQENRDCGATAESSLGVSKSLDSSIFKQFCVETNTTQSLGGDGGSLLAIPNMAAYPNYSTDTKPPLTEVPTMLSTSLAPCKITIKKINAPITSGQGMASDGSAAIALAQQTSPLLGSPSQWNVSAAGISPARGSYELFFDSVCASVKALPPKLATEAKIRVMQLVGELEIRAITDREQEHGAAGLAQQYPTVASTTK